MVTKKVRMFLGRSLYKMAIPRPGPFQRTCRRVVGGEKMKSIGDTVEERVVSFLWREIVCSIELLRTEQGRKILEEQRIITDEAFEALSKVMDITTFTDLLWWIRKEK